jgi:hypothetical protein
VAEGGRMKAYAVLSLLIGARPGDLRAPTWDHVDLVGKPEGDSPVPPCVAVRCPLRAGGGTKTRKPRRTLALPKRCGGGAPAAPGPAGPGTPGATPTYPLGLNLPAGPGETSDLRHQNQHTDMGTERAQARRKRIDSQALDGRPSFALGTAPHGVGSRTHRAVVPPPGIG